MAAAEVLDEAVLMASAWPLASDAAWLSAMPSLWQLRWLLVLPLQSASASASLRPQPPKYRPDPTHTRYSVDRHRRIESKRCEQPSYSGHRGSAEAGAANRD